MLICSEVKDGEGCDFDVERVTKVPICAMVQGLGQRTAWVTIYTLSLNVGECDDFSTVFRTQQWSAGLHH